MSEELHAKRRTELGSAACRRLRQSGTVPAVLYGHGEENVNLSLPEAELSTILRHGGQLVEVTGDVKESALLRDIQWDAFGTSVLHVDLARVSADEAVEVEVAVELRGEAPGTKQGGVTEQSAHGILIRCPAGKIPDTIQVSVNNLQLGEAINASELELPEKATLMTDGNTVIVQCVEHVEREELGAEAAEGVEPEVIGRPAEEPAGDS